MPEPTNSAAAIAAAAGHPVRDPSTMSTAERIAARVNTADAPQDERLRSGNPIQRRHAELRDALQRQGVPLREIEASRLGRLVAFAPDGDADAVAGEIVAQHPELLETRPQPSASVLVQRFLSGQTPGTPGS